MCVHVCLDHSVLMFRTQQFQIIDLWNCTTVIKALVCVHVCLDHSVLMFSSKRLLLVAAGTCTSISDSGVQTYLKNSMSFLTIS